MQSTGVLAEVVRVELLFVSSQLASTLRMDLHILPVVASLLTELPGGAASGGAPASRPESAPAAEAPEAASRMPVLEVTDLSASATVQLSGCAPHKISTLYEDLPRSIGSLPSDRVDRHATLRMAR